MENPRGSLFWRTTAWSRIRDLFTYTSFQACAYGGRRPKHTALAFTHPAFAKFCRSCPNCPDHLPWGLSSSGWATSAESLYPTPLCEQVTATLVQIFAQPSPDLNYHQLRASAALGETVKETIIFKAEVTALICATRQWKGLLSGKPTLFFVDNNSARDVTISGAALSPIANKLFDMLLLDECSAEIPSPSNPADAPSRSLMKSVTLHGAEVQFEDITELLKVVESTLSANLG